MVADAVVVDVVVGTGEGTGLEAAASSRTTVLEFSLTAGDSSFTGGTSVFSGVSTRRRFLGRSQSLLVSSSTISTLFLMLPPVPRLGVLLLTFSLLFSTVAGSLMGTALARKRGSFLGSVSGVVATATATGASFFFSGSLGVARGLRPRFFFVAAVGVSSTSSVAGSSTILAVSERFTGGGVSSSLPATELPTSGDQRRASGSRSSRDLCAAARSTCARTMVQSMINTILYHKSDLANVSTTKDRFECNVTKPLSGKKKRMK